MLDLRKFEKPIGCGGYLVTNTRREVDLSARVTDEGRDSIYLDLQPLAFECLVYFTFPQLAFAAGFT